MTIFIIVYVFIGICYFISGMCDPTPSIRKENKFIGLIFIPIFILIFGVIGFFSMINWITKKIK